MFALLCFMGSVIMLLAGILLFAIYRLYEAQEKASKLQSMVKELEDRPSLDGLSDYSKQMVINCAKIRRMHDGFRHETSQREKTRRYYGQWE